MYAIKYGIDNVEKYYMLIAIPENNVIGRGKPRATAQGVLTKQALQRDPIDNNDYFWNCYSESSNTTQKRAACKNRLRVFSYLFGYRPTVNP